MSHTILLVQPSGKPETRTYSDYESVNECMEGVCKMYEEHLKKQNPNIPSITLVADMQRALAADDKVIRDLQKKVGKKPKKNGGCKKKWFKPRNRRDGGGGGSSGRGNVIIYMPKS